MSPAGYLIGGRFSSAIETLWSRPRINTFLADNEWQRLASDLVDAAQHPVDPESAVKELLAVAGIMPECCREDLEGETQKTG